MAQTIPQTTISFLIKLKKKKNSTNWGCNTNTVTGIKQTKYTGFYTQTKTKNTFHLTAMFAYDGFDKEAF